MEYYLFCLSLSKKEYHKIGYIEYARENETSDE